MPCNDHSLVRGPMPTPRGRQGLRPNLPYIMHNRWYIIYVRNGTTCALLPRYAAHPFTHVVGKTEGDRALVQQCSLASVRAGVREQLLVDAVGAPGVGGDLRGKLLDRCVQLPVGHDSVDQAYLCSRSCADPPTREHQFLRGRPAHALGQPHRHLPDGYESPLAVSVAEACRLTGDQQIASKRQLESAGVAVAVDASDRRLRQLLKSVHRLRFEVLARCLLTLGDGAEIVASAEGTASAGEHDTPHLLVNGDCE